MEAEAFREEKGKKTHVDKEKKCYFESRHILGRMGNLKPLTVSSSRQVMLHTFNPRKSVACLIEQKGEGAAMSPWARHCWNAFCLLSIFNTAILHTEKKLD